MFANDPSHRDSQASLPPLQDESLIYFGPEPWDGLWRNRHQLMTRFARHNLVLYVEPPVKDVRKLRRLHRQGRLNWAGAGLRRIQPRLFVLKGPTWLPLLGKHPFNQLKDHCWHAVLRRSARRLGMRRPIVWLSRPSMADLLGVLDEKLSVYHVVDEYAGYAGLSAGQQTLLQQRETQLLQQADLTIVVSQALYTAKRAHGADPYLVRNAVDFEAYRAERGAGSSPPVELRRLARPIVGYSGLIANRLDLELLEWLARLRPQWSFVFVGDVRADGCAESIDRLAARPNVQLLGRRPVESVPDYVRCFDACLVPYRCDERAHHSSPLKVLEYAAAGRPIVATGFEAAREYDDFVLIGESRERFVDLLEQSLQWPADHVRLRRGIETASANTWEHRVAEIGRILNLHLDKKLGAGSGRPLQHAG